MTAVERYTSIPRPVLWLVPEGEVDVGGSRCAVEPFYLSTLPVTNRQLAAWLPGWERSPLAPADDDPAIGVSWEIATGYCRWYAALARKWIRLPTDAEWIHACRAGVNGRWWKEMAIPSSFDRDTALAESDRDVPPAADHHDRAEGVDRVPALAATRTNPFGLHAMVGGVWEWVDGAEGPLLRGGCWRTAAAELSCEARRLADPRERLAEAGFRIARALRG